MAIPITVPRLGWNMEQGVFLGWLKADGAAVRAGEALFTLESDKATEDIRGTLATEWYLDIERRFEQVSAFMKEVELEGLEWMGFRYLNK